MEMSTKSEGSSNQVFEQFQYESTGSPKMLYSLVHISLLLEARNKADNVELSLVIVVF